MSFEPVTRWALRCDGHTTHGQCTEQLGYIDTDDPDDPLAIWEPVIYEKPELTQPERHDLRLSSRSSGWLLIHDRRILCPRHVAALEHLARAAVDGLPFDDHAESGEGDPR